MQTPNPARSEYASKGRANPRKGREADVPSIVRCCALLRHHRHLARLQHVQENRTRLQVLPIRLPVHICSGPHILLQPIPQVHSEGISLQYLSPPTRNPPHLYIHIQKVVVGSD